MFFKHMANHQPVTPSRSGKFVFQVLMTFLPMAMLLCGAAYYFYYSMQDRAAIHNRLRETAGIEIGRNVIDDTLMEIRRDLAFVSEDYALKCFLDRPMPAEMRDFEQDMLNLASSSHLYDQVRWLDETGMERVRVNFNNGNPMIMPVEALQNKRARYYFPASIKLERGEVYISPLDLNIEHERVEIPHKPMLRIATPVFDKHGDKRGIVVLNYFGAELLARFNKATAEIADHAMLLNQDGYWLKSPRPDEAWGFMFGRDQLTLARRHPAAWQRIVAQDSGQFEDAEGLWTFATIYPELGEQNISKLNALADRTLFWKLVAHLPSDKFFGSHPLLNPILVALAASLLLQFAWSWKLTHIRRLRKETQDQVLHTNQNLERLVEERTLQLRTDIDLRMQAENALHAKEFMLSESQRIAHVGSWQVDFPVGKMTWSEETYRIFGLQPETFTPDLELLYALIHTDDRLAMRGWVNACLEGKHPSYLEYRTVLPNNCIRILSCRGDMQYDSENRPFRMIGTMQDITQQKQVEIALRDSVIERVQMERQLQQSQKMEALGQLTGGIAHDFNNILAVMLGYSNLALTRYAKDKESTLAHYLEEVIKAGERARDLVTRMLTYSRSQVEEVVAAIDPAPLVKEAIQMLASTISSGIKLQDQIAADIPTICISPGELQQIVMNLVINARDAMVEHGCLDIRLNTLEATSEFCKCCKQAKRNVLCLGEICGEYVSLSVTDTGGGISPENLKLILDPFFTTKDVGKGTGLGLSVVQGIVRRAGGYIVVDSHLGMGTTVQVLFPVAYASQGLPTATVPAPTILSANGARILVVDDESALAHYLADVLEGENYVVDVYTDAVKALNYFCANPQGIDAVITDQTMPNKSGIEIARVMLALRPDLPVFLCSGYSNTIDEASAQSFGIRRFFYKPVSATELLTALDEEIGVVADIQRL